MTTTIIRLFLLHWLVFSGSLGLVAAPPKSKEREYSLGPLKIDEFRGEVEAQNNTTAHTATRVRYQFEFAFSQFGQQVTVIVKSIELRVVFLPEESWFGPDATPELLDHEQGHFDVAEINARRAELAIEKAKLAGRMISATGNSRQAAHQAIMEKLNEIGEQVDKQIADENVEYDRSTRHGFKYSEQSELRKIQKLTLEALGEELGQLNPKFKARALRARRTDFSSTP